MSDEPIHEGVIELAPARVFTVHELSGRGAGRAGMGAVGDFGAYRRRPHLLALERGIRARSSPPTNPSKRHAEANRPADGRRKNADIDWIFRVGGRVKIRLLNKMAGDHPMHHSFHIHGTRRFLVLARDGEVEPNLVWTDTVLIPSGQSVDIVLRARASTSSSTSPTLGVDGSLPLAERHESGMMFSFDVVD